jgi:uncharacterized oxidoreductase
MRKSQNTILVTGGGSGIGRAFARRLHDAGNRVIVAGRTPAALEETAAGRPRMAPYELDIADPASVDAFAARVVRDHPGLNVLVNNAGVMRRENLRVRRDLSDAEETIATNLLGPIRLTNALVEHLAKQECATIINVTSGLAFVPLAASPSYSASKSAMHAYTLCLRQQLRDLVTVVEWAPPALQTELTPGQSQREGYMPLEDFMDESMRLLAQRPLPPEILVERVHWLRGAEAEGRFDQVLQALAQSGSGMP